MFLKGDCSPDPLNLERILKIPECSSSCPRAGSEARVMREAPHSGRSVGPGARRAVRGDFQNLRTGDWDLTKIPDQKHKFCIYFFLSCLTTEQYEYYCYYSYFVPKSLLLRDF